MTVNGWIQLGLYFVVLVAAAKPLGWYMARVYQGQPCGLDRALGWLERLMYRLAGVDPRHEMSWRSYTVAVLLFNGIGLLAVYGLLRLQHLLPLNPQRFAANTPDLAFNTAASFATNTNWQSYGGETTMSYLSQMLGLDGAELRLGGVRHGGAGGADSRTVRVASRRPSATSGSTSCGRPSTSCCRFRSSWPWHWSRRASFRTFKPYETANVLRSRRPARRRHKPVTEQTLADGTGRFADRDQATRHQRRRFLQCELGASL